MRNPSRQKNDSLKYLMIIFFWINILIQIWKKNCDEKKVRYEAVPTSLGWKYWANLIFSPVGLSKMSISIRMWFSFTVHCRNDPAIDILISAWVETPWGCQKLQWGCVIV